MASQRKKAKKPNGHLEIDVTEAQIEMFMAAQQQVDAAQRNLGQIASVIIAGATDVRNKQVAIQGIQNGKMIVQIEE